MATVFNANEVLLSTEINHICANLNNQREQHSLTYAEAEQLINNGAYLLYADCITLAAHSDIAIRLIDTNDTATEKLYISSHDTKNNIKSDTCTRFGHPRSFYLIECAPRLFTDG